MFMSRQPPSRVILIVFRSQKNYPTAFDDRETDLALFELEFRKSTYWN